MSGLVDEQAVIVAAESIAVAEALALALAFGHVAPSAQSSAALLQYARDAAAPRLVILVGDDVGRVAALAGGIRRHWSTARILAVGIRIDTSGALRCLAVGINGIVANDERLEVLRRATSILCAGGTYLPPGLAMPLPAKSLEALSARERDVLRLVADGLTNKEIAQRLRLELQTVKNHVGQVLRKLGLRSRFELAHQAADARRRIGESA